MFDPEIQFERLRRHFDACSESYDPISLLDLAHSLRVASEYKSDLGRVLRRTKHCPIYLDGPALPSER